MLRGRTIFWIGVESFDFHEQDFILCKTRHWHRRAFDVNDLAILGRLVAVEISNKAGDTIVARTMETQDDGNFNLSFKLPPNAQLGNYTVSASFSQLGQITTADAIFELVTIVGDLNRDWAVDIVIVALEFDHPPPPIVDPRADVNILLQKQTFS